MSALVTHLGSCHCGSVKWELRAPEELECIKCNCSICYKKQNHHFIVSKDNFKLLQGEDAITTYKFNEMKAKHTFCKICGVQSFYTPRSNPNDIAIMPHCIDSETVKEIKWSSFDGQNWEKCMEDHAPKAFTSDGQ